MRSTYLIYILGLVLFLTACTRIDGPDDIPDDLEKNPWIELDYNIERKILNSFSAPDAIFFITPNEFLRINDDKEIVEKRLIPGDDLVLGQPSISVNTFVRLTENAFGGQNLEFYLTNTPGEVLRISNDELSADNSETIRIEHTGRQIGAFNFDGSQFIAPAISFSGNIHYVFFLIQINLDPQTLNFDNIEVIDRIDIQEITATNALSSLRYLNGNYYVASKNGGFRITTDGTVLEMSDVWIKDYYMSNGLIFATGANDQDFFNSADNGITWSSESAGSPMKIVERKGAHFFSQTFAGFKYNVSVNGFENIEPILLNEDFPNDNNSYFSIEYFSDEYYLSVGNKLYRSPEIKLEE